jgi:hypothetical protein
MKAHDLVGQSRCRHEIPNETIQISEIEGLTYEGGSTVFDCLRPEAIILASGYDDDANRRVDSFDFFHERLSAVQSNPHGVGMLEAITE